MLSLFVICSAYAMLAPQRADTVRARVVVVVGESSAAAPAFFGEISGFAFDRTGRLYVTDFKEPRVVVLDQSGRQLAVIGRKGEGPGEFQAPTGPAFGPDGALYVRNLRAVSRFAVDAKTGLATKFDSNFTVPAMAPWRSKESSLVDARGRFLFPWSLSRQGGLSSRFYLRYALDGRFVDTLPVPRYPTAPSLTAFVMTSRSGGRMVAGLNVAPFAPVPAWTATTRGTVVSGAGDRYDLGETDAAGAVIRRLTRAEADARVPAAERAESALALKRRIDTLPVPIEQVQGAPEDVRLQRLPAVLPAFIGVVSAANGDVWVRRWPRAKGTSVFDVFSANGRYARTVVVPRACANEPAPVVQGSRFACLVVDAETGEELILLAAVAG